MFNNLNTFNNVAKMIYVTDAARRLGVSDQTIRNWAEKGVLKIKKMGRAHYVDGDLVDQIGDFASDVVKSQQALERLRQEIDEERRKEHQALYDKVNYRRYTNLCVEGSIRSNFFKTVVELMKDYHILVQREADMLTDRLNGKSLEDICSEYGLTRERVRQISEKAIRKSREIDMLRQEIQNIDALKADIQAMKSEIRFLKVQLHIQQKEEELTDEDRKRKKTENDSLCQLLSTRLVDCHLSVRSLKCIMAYHDTEGHKDVVTIGDLCKLRRIDMLKQRNFGKKSLEELEGFLNENGLEFGMDVDKLFKDRASLMNI